VQHNTLTGRGGGLLAELVEDAVPLSVSIHNSVFTHNTVSRPIRLCVKWAFEIAAERVIPQQ
jgi:hypothetical protein